ncbi:hypothetical protein CC78DRAFT_592515 [Lojkania enalia]|uniref:CCHC-type domain-containing protein n=1 Tax=Lojkania enalia TaxID=147567 RepID=A0A9P4JZK3_9PLEO|nr:hypothetical protein CC78DRAFT_592515 [Didymosphaeria enalia]
MSARDTKSTPATASKTRQKRCAGRGKPYTSKIMEGTTSAMPSPDRDSRKDLVMDFKSPTRAKKHVNESFESPDKPATMKKIYLTSTQLLKLKSGATTCIFVGPKGDQFIGVEGAYVKVLAHFSGLAKQKLVVEHGSRLSIPDGSKSVVVWIYKYMLAGEKDPKGLQRFKDLTIQDLVKLYSHCAVMEYSSLHEKASKRLEYKLCTVVPDVQSIRNISAFIPSLTDAAAGAIARLIVRPLAMNYTPYIQHAEHDNVFGAKFDALIQELLEERVAASERYYFQTLPNRGVQESSQYYRSLTPPPPPLLLKGINKVASTGVGARGRGDNGSNSSPVVVSTNLPTKPKKSKKSYWSKKARSRKNKRGEPAEKVSYPVTHEATEEDCSPNKPIVRLPNPLDSKKVALDKDNKAMEGEKKKGKRYRPRSHKSRAKAENVEAPTFTQDPENVLATSEAMKMKQQLTMARHNLHLVCYNCNRKGHVAHYCNTTAQDAVAQDPSIIVAVLSKVPEPSASSTSIDSKTEKLKAAIQEMAKEAPEPTKNPRRPVPTCYNCNEQGHIARYCPLPINHGPTGVENDPSILKAVRLHSPGSDVQSERNSTLADVTNIHHKYHNSGGRNRFFKRARADRRNWEPIQVCGNGEGLRTCDREVRQGEVTRLGLVI